MRLSTRRQHAFCLVLLVGIFIVAPGLCVVVDGEHAIPRPDCPYCVFLASVAAALVCAGLALLCALPLFAEFVSGALAAPRRAIVRSLPSIRAPPSVIG